MPDALVDLLLPTSDRAAIAQIGVAALMWTAVLVRSRRWRPEYRTFATGLAVMTFAWFGARMLH